MKYGLRFGTDARSDTTAMVKFSRRIRRRFKVSIGVNVYVRAVVKVLPGIQFRCSLDCP